MSCFVALVIGGTLSFPAVCGSQHMGAYFEKESTTWTDTFHAGPEGGTFTVPVRGTPTDGVSLQLPEKAVHHPVTITVGYCKGHTTLPSGIPSGVVLAIKSAPEGTFQQPLKIGVSFPPDPRHATLVGYAIDEKGRFRPIDIVDLNMQAGRVSFLTFQELTLTWAYVER